MSADNKPKEAEPERNTILHLNNIDHATFALFPKFIYTTVYPTSVDIHPATPQVRCYSPHSPPQSILAYVQSPMIPPSVHGKSRHFCLSRGHVMY